MTVTYKIHFVVPSELPRKFLMDAVAHRLP